MVGRIIIVRNNTRHTQDSHGRCNFHLCKVIFCLGFPWSGVASVQRDDGHGMVYIYNGQAGDVMITMRDDVGLCDLKNGDVYIYMYIC